MDKLRKVLRDLHRNEEGITGLETAIILIAFVIVASVFAFVVLSTGLVSAERGKLTVLAGLEKAQGNLEVKGSVTVTSSAGTPDKIIFNLATAAAGKPTLIDPAATSNSLVINYIDEQDRRAHVDYTANFVLGDGDNLLENGELVEISIALPVSVGGTATTSNLAVNESFTIEVIPPGGGALIISRTMPPQIDAVMDLH